MSGDEPPPVRVEAQAAGNAQQAVLGQGVQHNYFYAAPPGPPAPGPSVVDTLVPPPPTMVGRTQELDRLRATARAASGGHSVSITVIHGPGGVGKTALVRALAAEIAADFPDARIEIDLSGFTPGRDPRLPADVLGELLALTGFAAADVPAGLEGRSLVWRSWLAPRRVLLVLDNARDAAQVRPMMPGAGTPGRSQVLLTSRNQLTDLDVTGSLGLRALPTGDAIDLLGRLAHRRDPVETERGPVTGTSVEDPDLATLAGLCGHLPLALRAVGSLLTDLRPAELVEVMRSSRRPLENLPDADRAAAAAFAVSYDALDEPLRRVLRACARHPGPDFDAVSVAALAGRPPALLRIQLVGLLRATMLTALPGDRYAFFDLFLGYTRQRSAVEDAGPDVTEGQIRLVASLDARLAAATALMYVDNRNVRAPAPGQSWFREARDATAWLSQAADELVGCAHAALAGHWPGAVDFGSSLAYWMHAEGRPDKAWDLYAELAELARARGDRLAEADALAGTGIVAWTRGEHDAAEAAFRQAGERYAAAGRPSGEATSAKGLGDVLRAREEHDSAIEAYRRARELYAAIGDRRGESDALSGLADSAFSAGRPARAEEAFEQARRIAEEAGYRSGQADALCGIGDVAKSRHRLDAARRAYAEARDVYTAIGNRHGLAYALKGLADVGRVGADHDSAARLYEQALAIYEQIGFARYQVQILNGLSDLARARGDDVEAAAYSRRAAALTTG
jgi:tetratricopeptide (TPR) repeat protein